MPPGSTRCGLPSISWKWCVMAGNCLAAWTMAYPIKWVNEIFLPLAASCALRAFRRASSVVAEMSRNEVAVGTVNDSVMFATNRAAGPVIGIGSLEPGVRVGGAGEVRG